MGLADTLGLHAVQKKLARRFPYSLIPPQLPLAIFPYTTKDSDDFCPPWPDVVIASGARLIPFALCIKKASPKTCVIYIQDPRIGSKYFDFVISMAHDRIEGSNVIQTQYSLNRVDKKLLLAECKKHSGLFKKLPKPFFAVLLGGDHKNHKLTDRDIGDVIEQINAIRALNKAGSLLISTSNRTPQKLIDLLRQNFKSNNVFICDPKNKVNPYYAILHLAKHIFVTNDSVSMISESLSTGKSVYILEITGLKKAKSLIFVKNLIDQDVVASFDVSVKLQARPKTPVNEGDRVARILQGHLIANCGFKTSDFRHLK